MPTSTRSLSPRSRLRSSSPRRLALILGSTTLLLLALLLAAVPAGAVVVTDHASTTTVGLQPRSTTLFEGLGTDPERFANASGAPILPANKTYAIYWDPTDHYHGDWQHLIDGFFQRMGAASGMLASVFSVDAQYTDAANQHALYQSTFMGAYTDTDAYPATGNCADPHPLEGESYPTKELDKITCLTNGQIQAELKSFIAEHNLQKGMGTIFYLLTPPGVTVCLDGGTASGHCSDYTGSTGEESYRNSFCSYHSDVNPDDAVAGDSNTILYAAIPWTAGGRGDDHLATIDRTSGYECQDGGFDPSSKPVEEKEKIKTEHTALEEEEFDAKTIQEKREQAEAEELGLEAPHAQEPNQHGVGPDGSPDTGLADLIVNQIAVEQQNTVTDPLLDSWKDPSGNEATDECRNYFARTLGGSVTANPETDAGTLFNQSLGGGDYYLNAAFNLAALKLPYPGIPCLTGVSLDPEFTVPNQVNAGEVVGFNGMESNITLDEGTAYTGTSPKATYATYTWSFGDGSPTVTGFAPGAPTQNSPETSPCPTWLTPCAATTFHTYKYGGTYEVTLTVIDTGGHTASVTEPITVSGEGPPAPPSPPAPPAPSPGAAGPAGTAAGSPTPAATNPTPPGPVASAAITSHSLASVLSKGLPVSYSVNEQVAGRFQVLLAASVAKRIGLHGALATGLAKGTPPQIVIAGAVLVTTKGGHNTIKIKFGKKTAAKLHKLRKVSLMVRLIVRNSSRGAPTTTVLSTVTLTR